MPGEPPLDVPLLEALLRLAETPDWPTFDDALFSFNNGSTDSPDLPGQTRLVHVVSAFEQAPGCRNDDENALATRFTAAWRPARILPLLSPTRNLAPRGARSGGSPRLLPEIWIRDLFRYRNPLAHGHADRVVFIDFRHLGHVLGFNPTRQCAGADIGVEASRDLQVLCRVWGQDSILKTPRIATNGYNAFYAIRKSQASYLEALELLATQPTDAGHALVRQVENRVVRKQLDALHDATELRREERVESIVSRIKLFLNNEHVRRTVGQTERVLDPARIIDEKKIFIVNLQESDQLTDEDTRLLGVLIFSAFAREAIRRKRSDRRPFTILADEFHRFVSNEAALILATGRKFMARLVLAAQYPEQLVQTGGGILDRGVLEAVRACCRTKILFGDLEPDQYEAFAGKLALKRWDPYRVKQELSAWRQLVRGYNTVKLHGRSSSHGRAAGAGDAVPYSTDLFGMHRPAPFGTASESASESDTSSESGPTRSSRLSTPSAS